MLAVAATDLAVDLVVEVLGEVIIGSLIDGVASGSNQLLELDPRDKVLVLRRHEAVILGEHEDLVVALSTACLLFQIRILLLIIQLGQLRGMREKVQWVGAL